MLSVPLSRRLSVYAACAVNPWLNRLLAETCSELYARLPMFESMFSELNPWNGRIRRLSTVLLPASAPGFDAFTGPKRFDPATPGRTYRGSNAVPSGIALRLNVTDWCRCRFPMYATSRI